MILRFNSFRQASSSQRMSMARPSNSKTQEEDDLYDTIEVSEQGKLNGVDLTKTISKVYYNSSFEGCFTKAKLKPLLIRKRIL